MLVIISHHQNGPIESPRFLIYAWPSGPLALEPRNERAANMSILNAYDYDLYARKNGANQLPAAARDTWRHRWFLNNAPCFTCQMSRFVPVVINHDVSYHQPGFFTVDICQFCSCGSFFRSYLDMIFYFDTISQTGWDHQPRMIGRAQSNHRVCWMVS